MTSESPRKDRHREKNMIVRLGDDMREQLRQRAKDEERTQSQIIRRALRLYLAEVPVSD